MMMLLIGSYLYSKGGVGGKQSWGACIVCCIENDVFQYILV